MQSAVNRARRHPLRRLPQPNRRQPPRPPPRTHSGPGPCGPPRAPSPTRSAQLYETDRPPTPRPPPASPLRHPPRPIPSRRRPVRPCCKRLGTYTPARIAGGIAASTPPPAHPLPRGARRGVRMSTAWSCAATRRGCPPDPAAATQRRPRADAATPLRLTPPLSRSHWAAGPAAGTAKRDPRPPPKVSCTCRNWTSPPKFWARASALPTVPGATMATSS